MQRLKGRVDLTGNRFGMLEVLSESEPTRFNGQTRRRWWCLCECGVELEVPQYGMTSGRTKSCGCLRNTNQASVTHGHARAGDRSSTYESWGSMVKRCVNPRCRQYKWYGGRGIGFDPRWASFHHFLSDMGERPNGLTLERKRVNEGYCKDNCEWVPKSQQASNKTTSLRYEHLGREQCLKDWCRELGLSYMTIYKRIRVRGWTFEEAISTPT